MTISALVVQNEERAIDALARNNNIIRSLFHYDKPISFLVVSLAIQKIKIGAHQEGLVTISREEIKRMLNVQDSKIGINKLLDLIKSDLEEHNFFNYYNPNSGLKNIRKGLIKTTAYTNDLFQDLVIDFETNLFDVFKSESNYTIQSLNQLRNCKENQATMIYTLTQPYAKKNSPDLKIGILDLRFYLRVDKGTYELPRSLTMRIKKICEKITEKTDINLTVTPLYKSGTTGSAVAYQFHSEFKNEQKNKTITGKTIKQKPISIRQQLVNWNVGKKQIDLWLANLPTKEINAAIQQTLNRPKRGNSNPGGYIYSILGNGKQLQLTKVIKDKEVASCLRNFGLTDEDIAKVKKQTINNKSLLTAITNKCLRELDNEAIGTDDMRQFFIDQLDGVLNELK